MTRRTTLAALAAALLLGVRAPPTSAQGFSTERFVEWCGDPASDAWRKVGEQVCPSYIRGLIDGVKLQAIQVAGLEGHRRVMGFCITEGVGAQDAIDAVLRYVEANPDSRRAPAAATVYVALAEAWPCPP